nr:MAG TPA: hypothetical protein [Bacteriophage sp.]
MIYIVAAVFWITIRKVLIFLNTFNIKTCISNRLIWSQVWRIVIVFLFWLIIFLRLLLFRLFFCVILNTSICTILLSFLRLSWLYSYSLTVIIIIFLICKISRI